MLTTVALKCDKSTVTAAGTSSIRPHYNCLMFFIHWMLSNVWHCLSVMYPLGMRDYFKAYSILYNLSTQAVESWGSFCVYLQEASDLQQQLIPETRLTSALWRHLEKKLHTFIGNLQMCRKGGRLFCCVTTRGETRGQPFAVSLFQWKTPTLLWCLMLTECWLLLCCRSRSGGPELDLTHLIVIVISVCNHRETWLVFCAQ